MKDGFIRVAAATPDIHVADPQYNSEQIIELMEQGMPEREGHGVSGAVFNSLYLLRLIFTGNPVKRSQKTD